MRGPHPKPPYLRGVSPLIGVGLIIASIGVAIPLVGKPLVQNDRIPVGQRATTDLTAPHNSPLKAPLRAVVVAARDIGPGEEIAATDVAVAQRPADFVPESAFIDASDVIGRLAAGPIPARSALAPIMFAQPIAALPARGQ